MPLASSFFVLCAAFASFACSIEASSEVGADASVDVDGVQNELVDAGENSDLELDVPASDWTPFEPGTEITRPIRSELLPLPGEGTGAPVLTSNNPEVVTGDGVLYTNKGPLPTRGGEATPLEGTFGVYLHHINLSGGPRSFSLLVTNPNSEDVTVSLRGAGYSQTQTGTLELGASPDYLVSREWISDLPSTIVQPTTISQGQGTVLWTRFVENNREVDGRFEITSSAPVFVYVVMAENGSLQKALDVTQPMREAPGDYRISGMPAPPFGREAGVYEHDTWTSRFSVEIPETPGRVSFMVNTATGAGLEQIQAFPALSHLDGSAAESVGMYGNVYDFVVYVTNTTESAQRVRAGFHSLADGNASRWWDGAAVLDDTLVDIRHVPGDESTILFDETIAAGATRPLRFRAMVPGLAAIPQALTIERF